MLVGEEIGVDRWAGVFLVAGVLLPMALWFLFEYLGPRVRATIGVLSALMLLLAVGRALGRMSFLGFLVTGPALPSFDGRERAPLYLLLMLLGLGLGLVVAIAVRSREEAEAAEEPEDDLHDLDDLDDLEYLGEDDDAEDWAPVDRRTLLPLPADAGRVTFLLVVLALAVPVTGFGFGSAAAGLHRITDVEVFRASAHVVDGLRIGLALLLPALVLRTRETWLLVAGYAAVAFGQGLAVAWPEVSANRVWFVFATGLVAGLAGPPLLRLLTPELPRDGVALAVGILLAIGLTGLYTALDTHATFRIETPPIGELGDG